MKIKNLFIASSAAALALFATSCKKNGVEGNAVPKQTVIENQLQKVSSHLNQVMEGALQLTGFKAIGDIKDDAQKNTLLTTIFDEHAPAVSGIANQPASITFGSARTFHNNPASLEMVRNIKEHVTATVKPGDLLYDLTWRTKNNQEYHTTMIGNEKGIVWDNFLFNLPEVHAESTVNEPPVGNPDGRATQVFTAAQLRISQKVLGGEVAWASYDLQAVWDYTLKKYTSHIPSARWGFNFLGNSFAKGNSYYGSSTQRTVKGRYGLAVATSNVSISITGGSTTTNFSVSFSGGAGQQAVGEKLINTPVGQ
jgi:hypothetical protein